MAKSSEEAPRVIQKGAYICAGCKQEFIGTGACPECGNAKGNFKLAPDGIEQELHKTDHLFSNLRSAEDIMIKGAQQQIESRRIKSQMDELDDSLREAQVMKAKIKLHDQEMALRRKEIEARKLEEASEDYLSGRSSVPPRQPAEQEAQTQQMPQMPFMNTLSPQAIFMQQLMKMDGKKRAEFIEQLEQADPTALANLASMFPPAQHQQHMYPYQQNQYGQYPMMPPWMAPQQPSQNHEQSSVAIATSLVNTIFELTQKAAPRQDDSMKEALMELKSALGKVHDRIDTIVTKERDKDVSPILDKLNSLEQKVNNGNGRRSIVDQVNELTQLVEGLEHAGLVKRSGTTDKTVDDELKLKEFEFKRETENRKLEQEEKKIEAEQSKASLQQNIVATLLQRGIQKGLQDRTEEGQHSVPRTPVSINKVKTTQTPELPVEVISEMKADGGVVRETRRPVKRVETGVA